MSIARAEDDEGIKDWIRLARADIKHLCRAKHLSRDYVNLVMRQVIRDRAEAAFEAAVRDRTDLTPGQTEDIKQHCLDFYTALLREVAEE
jgi:hypothetical protein